MDGVPFNGKISDINPADIASISVSKDAVSNSLYGSRAAGGVVMITTKTGRNDKLSINFSGTWGITQRAYKDYDMVTDPGEFYRLTWYGIRNTLWAGGNSIEDSNLGASQNLLGELGNYNAFIIPDGEYLVNPDGQLNPSARLRYNDSLQMPCSGTHSVRNTTYRHREETTVRTIMCLWVILTMTLIYSVLPINALPPVRMSIRNSSRG